MSPIPNFNPASRPLPAPAPVRRSRSEGKSAARAPSRTAAKKRPVKSNSSSRVPPADLTLSDPVSPTRTPSSPSHLTSARPQVRPATLQISRPQHPRRGFDISAAALSGASTRFTPRASGPSSTTWAPPRERRAVRYSTFEARAGKKKTHGQFEVKAVKWDEAAAARTWTCSLWTTSQRVRRQAQAQGFRLRRPKAIAKLRKQVRKTRRSSRRPRAPLSVEGMHEDVDFRSTIKRTTFEELAAGWVFSTTPSRRSRPSSISSLTITSLSRTWRL